MVQTMSFKIQSECFVCGRKVSNKFYSGSYHGFGYSCCESCSDCIMTSVHAIYGCEFARYSFERRQNIVFGFAFKVQRNNLGKYKVLKQSEEILNC